MAQVDFSNAVLDVNTGEYDKPLSENNYIGLGDTNAPALYNSSGTAISTNAGKSFLTNTPTKVSILYTGTFAANGSTCYIVNVNTGARRWKISNISFSSGDTYAFVIDIEVSGNT